MTVRWMAALAACAACGSPQVPRDPASTVRVTIPRGASLHAVAESLVTGQVIRSGRVFRLYTVMTGRDRAIHAGIFDVPPDPSLDELLTVLTSGTTAYGRLVIPEGFMLVELAAAVEEQLGVPAESVLSAAADTALLRRAGTRAATLEGYLYPSTYHVPIGAGARDVLSQMLDEFDARWEPRWRARLDTLGMTREDIVILASIIEGEVRHDRDRTFVSSVYHNRLNAGWRLQADPTVIYALGRRRRLFEKDYLTASPYNTYLIDGLPPGPIGQPSAASLEAALYPAETDFFFFVAQPDGHHVFSRTLREHNAAIARIRSGAGR